MAQWSFKPYKGKWIIKEHTVAAAAAAIEAGDLMQFTSGGITIALGTSTATAIVGIAAEDSASSASTRTLRVYEPENRLCEMEGKVTDGAIAVGDTDSGRTCDLEDHEGVDCHYCIVSDGWCLFTGQHQEGFGTTSR